MKRLLVILVLTCIFLCSCTVPQGGTQQTGSAPISSTQPSREQGTADSAQAKDDILVKDPEGEEEMEESCFFATVTKNGTAIEAECHESQCLFGEVIINVRPDTVFKNAQGEIISQSAIKAGDKIKVKFDGIATRSLPPQVVADEIVCLTGVK
ncbi:MAG: hypothetical protein IJ309_03030 [Clostridia bacterium]|nr:hypothetical protein [Clostridia bacterium]